MTSTTIRHTLHREYVDFVNFKKNKSRMYKDLSNNPQKIYKPQNDYHEKQSINVITVTSVFMTVVPMGQTGSPSVTFIHLSQNSISRDKWADVPPVTQPTVANHWKKHHYEHNRKHWYRHADPRRQQQHTAVAACVTSYRATVTVVVIV